MGGCGEHAGVCGCVEMCLLMTVMCGTLCGCGVKLGGFENRRVCACVCVRKGRVEKVRVRVCGRVWGEGVGVCGCASVSKVVD